jgi:hypothetical protein
MNDALYTTALRQPSKALMVSWLPNVFASAKVVS